MVSVTLISKSNRSSIDGDWDTAIDFVSIESSHEEFELLIEDVPTLITLTESWKQSSYYVENEVAGGYGPEMEYEPREFYGTEAEIKWFDFENLENYKTFDQSSKEWKELIDTIDSLKEGKTVDISMDYKIYKVISDARLNEKLETIYTNLIPGYDRYTDYR